MSTRRRALLRVARGYTIVELLMSLSVLAIGASGVIAMQKVAIASNRHAKDLSVATRIAEAWADQLALDASLWMIKASGASTLANTTWLKMANPSQTVDWFIPSYSPLRSFGPAFGALGAPVNPATRPELAQFCTHLRLAFLHIDVPPPPVAGALTAPTGTNSGNGVIRAQIRVFWQAEDSTVGLPTSANGDLCSLDSASLTANLGAFHVLYLTTAVRQSPQGLL